MCGLDVWHFGAVNGRCGSLGPDFIFVLTYRFGRSYLMDAAIISAPHLRNPEAIYQTTDHSNNYYDGVGMLRPIPKLLAFSAKTPSTSRRERDDLTPTHTTNTLDRHSTMSRHGLKNIGRDLVSGAENHARLTASSS